MKRRIRLTESDLHRVIKESVKRILKENNNDNNKVFPNVFWFEEENEIEFDDHIVYYTTEEKEYISVYDNYTNEWIDEEYLNACNNYSEEDLDEDNIFEVYETEITITRKQDGKRRRVKCIQDINDFSKYKCAEDYESLCDSLNVIPADTYL